MNPNIMAALAVALLSSSPTVNAEVISAKGNAEVSVKASGGDIVAARRIAKVAAETDAIVAAIKLKLNVNPDDPKAKKAIEDLAKQLVDNLKTNFNVEGDVLIAKTTLEVDSAIIFDLSKSLGLGSQTAIAAAKVLFLIDEYKGIATALEPGQPVESEIEYAHDKSSFSDRSARASGAESSAESSKSSSRSANAYSSKESAALSAKESAAVSGRRSESLSASDSGAAVNGRGGSAAASSSLKASGSSSLNAANSSSVNAASSSQKTGAASSQRAEASSSASASNFAAEQKDIAEQRDVVSYKVTQKFPDINNAKPSEGADELIAARLEQVAARHGLQYTSERDFRVEGGRRLLIKEIEKLSKFDFYLQKAAKGTYNAKYVVYGTAVINSEGKLPSGEVSCAGQLKVQSTNVDTGAALVSGTINKRAVGSSDQVCQANLATALATSLAATVGTEAQREIQRVASQGSSFEVVLYSALKVPPKVRKAFNDQLQKLAEDVAEGNVTDTSRAYTVQAKGNFKTRLEDFVEDMKDVFPELKDARMDARGNLVYVCIEGKCPE